MAWTKLRWAALFTSASLSCTTPHPPCTELASLESAIKLSAPDAGVRPLPAKGSLFSLRTPRTDSTPSEHVCTATRLTATTFVSARHCITDLTTSEQQTNDLGPNQLMLESATKPRNVEGCLEHRPTANADVGKPVQRVLAHPTLDLALLYIDEPVDEGSDEYMDLAPTVAETGSLLFIAGFGLTERYTMGELRAIEATLLEVEAERLTVQGLGGGACVGDSGGPLFAFDGTYQLMGVLSTGSASCWGKDYYVNLMAAQEWLEAHLEG